MIPSPGNTVRREKIAPEAKTGNDETSRNMAKENLVHRNLVNTIMANRNSETVGDR